jgi:hypothetical protein
VETRRVKDNTKKEELVLVVSQYVDVLQKSGPFEVQMNLKKQN